MSPHRRLERSKNFPTAMRLNTGKNLKRIDGAHSGKILAQPVDRGERFVIADLLEEFL